MRLRIDLAYDGTNFAGWAKQPNLRTVQGTIEQALMQILRVDPQTYERDGVCRLTVAGRTDAGVHALHQVCHTDIPDEILERAIGHMQVSATKALQLRLSRMMTSSNPDIAIHAVSQAPQGFDARFSALERTYVYRISDANSVLDPRMRNFVLYLDDTLDIDAMNEAAALTIGLHDFGSFAIANPGGTTIREVKVARWERVPVSNLVMQQNKEHYAVPHVESGLICFTIIADAFARNMVRSLAQACVQVGRGKKDVAWFAQKMTVPLREGSTGPIAAKGLTLEHVAYPDEDQLATRAQAIRAKRVL